MPHLIYVTITRIVMIITQKCNLKMKMVKQLRSREYCSKMGKYFKDLLNVKNERYNDEMEEPDNTDPVVKTTAVPNTLANTMKGSLRAKE